tara:strand:+ start:342 stop:464 length:123 start_codon:yes stop_codon:yes gene_type:complete
LDGGRRMKMSLIIKYLKEQYFNTYEGEWEDLLDEIRRYEE